MIFIANTLALNGGSTFLLRTCRELNRRKICPVILVLFGHDSSDVANELAKIARIVLLRDLVRRLFSRFCIKQFGVFLPFDLRQLKLSLGTDITSIHVMGIFGLIVAKRISVLLGGVPITVGVYHQNEFLFASRPSYLVRWVSGELSKLSSRNMIFFNEGNRQCYANKFNHAFVSSPVLPIGIELPTSSPCEWERIHVQFLLISVGNLVGFKTYNRHVINCLPALRMTYHDVCYEIYGDGEELQSLQLLAKDIGVCDLVKFCGRLNYKDFNRVVARAHVFVGSGTSILEAAAMGVPAIVGIESIMEPVTYGFISDVAGFSYNEAGLEMPLVSISKCINKVFMADGIELSRACFDKSTEFGVARMVDGLIAVDKSAELQDGIALFELSHLFLSFVLLAVLDMLGVDREFSQRRNQGVSQKVA